MLNRELVQLACAAGLILCGDAAAGGDAASPAVAPVLQLQDALQAVIEKVQVSVVEVHADSGDRASSKAAEGSAKDDPMGDFFHYFGPSKSPRLESVASGFCVDPPGTVVTAAHPIENMARIRVRLDEDHERTAMVVGIDIERDIAVLRISAEGLRSLEWAEESNVKPGIIVLAMGSPFGLNRSASMGIVSAVSRKLEAGSPNRFIQTDAAINSGNSGGPLVGLDGKVVGVNSAIFAPLGVSSGVGFAVPSSTAREVIRGLLESADRAEHGAWLGIVLARGRDGLAGAGVAWVFADSPASKAGLSGGDRVLATGEEELVDGDALISRIRQQLPGHPLQFRVASKGVTNATQLVPVERPSSLPMKPFTSEDSTPEIELPVSSREEAALAEALRDRDCPCPCCGFSLADCFGCSEAKGELSDATRFAQQGLDAAAIRKLLDAPICARVWIDYTQEKSCALLRELERVQEYFGPRLRVARRYYPSDIGNVEGWRATIVAVEVARQFGMYDRAHRALIVDNGKDWEEKVRELPTLTSIPKPEFREAVRDDRFEQQIWKDLSAAPAQFNVTRAPHLSIEGKTYKGKMAFEDLLKAFHDALLNKSI